MIQDGSVHGPLILEESKLEHLYGTFEKIARGLQDARRSALEARHGTIAEASAVEQTVAATQESDFLIVGACEALLRVIEEHEESLASKATPDVDIVGVLQTTHEFLDLNALVPKGIPRSMLSAGSDLVKLKAYVEAKRRRHSLEEVRDRALRHVRADYEGKLHLIERVVEAEGAAEHEWLEHVNGALSALTFSDHLPILVRYSHRDLPQELRIVSWNVLERQPDGVNPVLDWLPFVQKKSQAAEMMKKAVLHEAAVVAHANMIVNFVLPILTRNSENDEQVHAVCLEEVGQPVLEALRSKIETTDLVIAVSRVGSGVSQRMGVGCEARTVIIARGVAEPIPDTESPEVVIGDKSRSFAAMRLSTPFEDVMIVAVHAFHGKKDAIIKAAGVVKDFHERTKEAYGRNPILIAAGDWNGDVRIALDSWQASDTSALDLDPIIMQAGVVGAPTTIVDIREFPESPGIDAALMLGPSGGVLSVELFGHANSKFH